MIDRFRRPLVSWAVGGFGILTSILLVLEFHTSHRVADLPSHMGLEVGAYATLSVVCSIIGFAAHRTLAMRTALCIRAIIIALAITSLGGRSVGAVVAMGSLAAEWGIYDHHPTGFRFAAAAVALGSIALWRAEPSYGSPLAPLLLGIGGLWLAWTTNAMTGLREKLIATTDLADQLDTAVQRLSDANLGFQSYAESASVRSTREERERITREIHDIVGYTITNGVMMMEAAADMVRTDPQGATELMQTARENAERGLNEVRDALRSLRARYDAPESGLRRIVKLIHIFEVATGIDVKASFGNLPWTCGQQVDDALYHAVQEGLVNAFRHGHATVVETQFWIADETLHLNVWDNGIGADTIEQGIGLTGMRERAEALGGSIHTTARANGFQLELSIPFIRTEVR